MATEQNVHHELTNEKLHRHDKPEVDIIKPWKLEPLHTTNCVCQTS